jgi:ribonuclease P protein component
LKKRAEFLRVRDGRAWRSKSLVLQARRRPDGVLPTGGMTRFGFTATKRLGNAVIRNRARRRLKETVRLVAHALARPGYDYVVIARQGALTQPFELIEKDLRQALEGVHKDKPARA